MNYFMSSVSRQKQRALNEGINEHFLPQIQATLRSGPVRVPERSRKAPATRPECSSEVILNRNFRSSCRDEPPRDYERDET